MRDILSIPMECRASESGPVLHGVILTEGRPAARAREVFIPGAVHFPPEGIEIRARHGGASEARALPTRDADTGELRIAVPATDALRRAVDVEGRRFMSIEFRALQERTTPSGIREVLSAWVDGAALAVRPYYDTTGAEVREAREAAQGAAEALSWL